MSDEFSETVVVPDLRRGQPGVALTLEEGVVTIQRAGTRPAYVDLKELEDVVASLRPKG